MKKMTITFNRETAGNMIPYRRRKYMYNMSADDYGQPVTCNLPCVKARNSVNHIKNRAEGFKTPLPTSGIPAPSQYERFPRLRMVHEDRMASQRLRGNRIYAAGTWSRKSLVTGSASLPLRFISLPYLNGGYHVRLSEKNKGKNG